jgi:hypothetical protein
MEVCKAASLMLLVINYYAVIHYSIIKRVYIYCGKGIENKVYQYSLLSSLVVGGIIIDS